MASLATPSEPVTLWVSLIGPLLGIYYPSPFQDEARTRLAFASSRLARLWCAVYTEADVDAQIARWGGQKLPASYALALDWDSQKVFETAL